MEDVTPEEDIVDTQDDRDTLNKGRRKPFRFSMIGLEPGTILTSTLDSNITCIVISDSEVELDGERMSLSGATREIATRKGNCYSSGAYQGPSYWLYGDKTLNELRMDVEN